MDKERLKLIVKNLESLVNCLKSEIDSESRIVYNYQREKSIEGVADYDEIFEDN